MITLDDVRAALQLPDFDPQPAHARMAPNGSRLRFQHATPPRPAAVLVLLYPEADGLHLVLMRRTEDQRDHSGQISFPGGKHDPQDGSLTATALRETCEEVGVCEGITIIGQLSPIYIAPTNFDVTPIVGLLPAPPVFRPNPDEVAEVFSLSLEALLDETTKRQELWEWRGAAVEIPYYAVQGHKVWGATAVMLSEFEQRLRIVVSN
jgi:8-oxo-dGTP pyrophosphatase MutT (NUDIX family)